MSKVVKVLGYDVYGGRLEAISLHTGIINTINPHSYCVARKDEHFRQSLLNSQILLPDGIGIVMASKFLVGEEIQKIAGYDIFIHMLEQLELKKGTCFFLGASEETLKKVSTRLKKEYPNVTVGTYSPPFRQKFSEEENEEMANAINGLSPYVWPCFSHDSLL